MEKYFTKCGRTFQKNSTSSVTGYRIESDDKQCNGDRESGKDPCPFRMEVTKGWPPVFDRWECRAGSKKPNQKNEYSTNMNDKTSMYVKSLNIEFLNQVQAYCNSLEGCSGVGYNQDLPDCRRQLSISFTQNKKGISAKKAIVEKFFNPDKYKDRTCKECNLYGELAGESYNPYLHVCKHIYPNNRAGSTLPDIRACENFEENNGPEAICMEKTSEDPTSNLYYSFICRNKEKSNDCPCYGSGKCGAKEFSDNEFWYRYGEMEYDCEEFIKRITQAKDKRATDTELITPDQSINLDENVLDDHLGTIRERANNIINNYIEIGFRLLEIRDDKLYKSKGYDNLIDCVESELGMKKSTCYNLIRIAEKFGDTGSRSLKGDYRNYGYVQLLEMTTMSDEELISINPGMSKREIKQIKNSNRLEKKAGHIIDDNVIDVDYKVIPASVVVEKSNSNDAPEIMEEQIDIHDIIPFDYNNYVNSDTNDEPEQDLNDPEDNEEYIKDCCENCKVCINKCSKEKDTDDIIRRIDLAHDLVIQAIDAINRIPSEHINSVHASKQSVITGLFNATHTLMILRPVTRCTDYQKEKENLNLASDNLLKPLKIRKQLLESSKLRSPENSIEYTERINVINKFLNSINNIFVDIEADADEIQLNEINIIKRKILDK